MVDRTARKQFAAALREYTEGRVTNDAFLCRVPTTKDPAIDGIGRFAESLTHDYYPHRLQGRHALGDEVRQAVERCLLFLSTECEYDWPSTGPPLWLYLTLVVSGLGMLVGLLVASLRTYMWPALAVLAIFWSSAGASLLTMYYKSRWYMGVRIEGFLKSVQGRRWPFPGEEEYQRALAGRQ